MSGFGVKTTKISFGGGKAGGGVSVNAGAPKDTSGGVDLSKGYSTISKGVPTAGTPNANKASIAKG